MGLRSAARRFRLLDGPRGFSKLMGWPFLSTPSLNDAVTPMSESTRNPVSHDPTLPELPPVEPPSARFIIQLFVIPAVIVVVLVTAYLLLVQLPFGRLANGGRDVMDYVRSIKSENEHRRWRSAQELANLIHNDSSLSKDATLLGELTALLEQELKHPDPDKPELSRYLAQSLGTFQIDRAKPVDGVAVDPIATLTRAVGREQPTVVRVGAVISLSLHADRAGGSLGGPEALRALIAASADGEAEVRQHASYALGYFKGEDAIAALRKRVSEDEDAKVRYNAGAALARLGDLESAQVVKEMLSPADLAQTLKGSTASETDTAIQAVELEALWGLQASTPTKPALAEKLRPEIQSLAQKAPGAVRMEAQNLLKKLPANP